MTLTDSVGSALQRNALAAQVQVLPVGPLFAEAIRRMLSGTPLTPLLESWPPGDH